MAKAGANFFVNNNLASFIRKPLNKDRKFLHEVEKVYKKAGEYIKRNVKKNIRAMKAVGSGFMVNNVIYVVELSNNSRKTASVKIGTRAWYDILVAKGLGLHGGQRTVPSQYKPTPEQIAIATASPYTEDMRKRIIRESNKRSPKVPRPFFKQAIEQTRNQVKSMIYDGLWTAFKRRTGSGRGAKPRIKISNVFQGSF